jgi:hypothetical protein
MEVDSPTTESETEIKKEVKDADTITTEGRHILTFDALFILLVLNMYQEVSIYLI